MTSLHSFVLGCCKKEEFRVKFQRIDTKWINNQDNGTRNSSHCWIYKVRVEPERGDCKLLNMLDVPEHQE